MTKERILSYQLSQKISESELESLSIAGGTVYGTSHQTGDPRGGADMIYDIGYD